MIKNNNPVIISIESSASTCGVAVSQRENLLCEYNIFRANQHDKMLAVLIERTLLDLDFKMNEIDCIAVSSGPGSFTGLRIGAALAKGICYENQPKFIAVPTLEAVAYSLLDIAKNSNTNQILTLSKSHKNFYYYQIFDLEAKAKSEIVFTELEKIKIDNISQTFICGNFEEDELLSFFKTNGFTETEKATKQRKGIFPCDIAKLAYKMYLDENFIKSEEFTPIYVQDFQIKTNKK